MNYIPLIVVGVVLTSLVTKVLYSFVLKNSRKKELQMNTENFVVRETITPLVGGILFIIGGGGVLSGVIYLFSRPTLFGNNNNDGIAFVIFFYFIIIGAAVIGLAFCVIGIYNICIYFRKRLVVTGEELTYRPALGKSMHYTFYDITTVDEQQGEPGQIIINVYQDKKKIFSFDNTSIGYGLLRNKLQQSGHIAL